eukprot:TRINITY_DN21012_c0_g1_i1.p1 TRINITY_DN21012_c0_g1~~TRINITY_DN21012_c0_g1_i1.p1  ORF type:complete len:232 (-),score=44.51 TRINITY_DN21012_c0_g1_i1:339-947(-)
MAAIPNHCSWLKALGLDAPVVGTKVESKSKRRMKQGRAMVADRNRMLQHLFAQMSRQWKGPEGELYMTELRDEKTWACKRLRDGNMSILSLDEALGRVWAGPGCYFDLHEYLTTPSVIRWHTSCAVNNAVWTVAGVNEVPAHLPQLLSNVGDSFDKSRRCTLVVKPRKTTVSEEAAASTDNQAHETCTFLRLQLTPALSCGY